jgi:hypothetical protein
MRDLDPLILARLQFAFTVSFHIIFPTFSIGLASFLVIVEALWLKTGDLVYRQIYRFWLNIFAMSFAIGVVTGVVMSFEFGLTFAKFAQLAGPVIGPLIGYEALTAFFLEAGFLGIMLFGETRVGPKLHFFATCMVALFADMIHAAETVVPRVEGRRQSFVAGEAAAHAARCLSDRGVFRLRCQLVVSASWARDRLCAANVVAGDGCRLHSHRGAGVRWR